MTDSASSSTTTKSAASVVRGRVKSKPLPLNVLVACGLSFIATLFLVIAFASPYWFVKRDTIPNEFQNIGLWEVCFENFRHPKYFYERVFDGCHYVFSAEFRVMLEYIELNWFIAVQVFMLCGFVFILLALTLLIGVCFGYFHRQLPYFLICVVGLLCASIIFNFLGLCIFGARADDRDWMKNPQWCRLGWAYAIAIVGWFFEIAAAILFAFEMRRVHKTLVYNNERMYIMRISERTKSGGSRKL